MIDDPSALQFQLQQRPAANAVFVPRSRCACRCPRLPPLTSTGSHAAFHALLPLMTRALRTTSRSIAPPFPQPLPLCPRLHHRGRCSPRSLGPRAPHPASCATEPPPPLAMLHALLTSTVTPPLPLHQSPPTTYHSILHSRGARACRLPH